MFGSRIGLFHAVILGLSMAHTIFGQKDSPRPNRNRPNILTVFIDDMGWSDLSCYGGQRATTDGRSQILPTRA